MPQPVNYFLFEEVVAEGCGKETEIESRLFERNQRNPKTESRDHKEKERPLPSDP